MKNTPLWFKLLALALIAIMGFIAGKEFYELRHYQESVVVSPAFTKKLMLSDLGRHADLSLRFGRTGRVSANFGRFSPV